MVRATASHPTRRTSRPSTDWPPRARYAQRTETDYRGTNLRRMAGQEQNPWSSPCTCTHQMREHILDWDLDPEIDCRAEGCTCPEFTPAASERAQLGSPPACQRAHRRTCPAPTLRSDDLQYRDDR